MVNNISSFNYYLLALIISNNIIKLFSNNPINLIVQAMENPIMEISDELNELWVNLSSLGEGNVFAQWPEILKKMLNSEQIGEGLTDDFNFDYTLPSNLQWRTKIYLKLLAKQRAEER